jgi:hypothetical protein
VRPIIKIALQARGISDHAVYECPSKLLKKIGRIAAATTLGKDVIDLLEKKMTLLTEQITTLETENTNLERR